MLLCYIPFIHIALNQELFKINPVIKEQIAAVSIQVTLMMNFLNVL